MDSGALTPAQWQIVRETHADHIQVTVLHGIRTLVHNHENRLPAKERFTECKLELTDELSQTCPRGTKFLVRRSA